MKALLILAIAAASAIGWGKYWSRPSSDPINSGIIALGGLAFIAVATIVALVVWS